MNRDKKQSYNLTEAFIALKLREELNLKLEEKLTILLWLIVEEENIQLIDNKSH